MAQSRQDFAHSRTLEQRFRRWTATQDRRLTSFLVTVVVLAVSLFAGIELVFITDGTRDVGVLICRAAALATSLACIVEIRRRRSPRVFDQIVTAWLVSILVMQIAVALLRPAGWSPVPIVNMLLVLGAYSLLPIPTRYLAVPVLGFTAVNLAILVLQPGPLPGRIQMSTTAAYVVANVLGLLVSQRLQRSRRRQFRILEREREARRRLRAALDEVKVLRGIVPICSFCKKVRNDDGLYEAVESYLSRHSEADFSHTLCPDCLHEQYPAEVLSP